jgi:phosphate transport system substrate-binding protein
MIRDRGKCLQTASRSRTMKSLPLLTVVGLSLLAGCDSQAPENVQPLDATGATAASGASSPGADVAGPAIRAVGSSTVYPFTTAVAEQFKRRFPQAATPIVESTGTGGGIKLFCNGVGAQHPDIANASRRIKASEVKACRENGVTNIIEVQIGIDGIALAQANDAPPIRLTARDIYLALAATGPEGKPNAARTWRDVNPALPATRIEVLGPPPTSGTRDAFNELIMEAGCKTFPALAALKDSDEDRYKSRCTKVREDGPYVEAGENDNLIVQKLAANPNALGIFGFSYLEENADAVRGVALGGVQPTYANIADFSYPASRPLYVYAKGAHVRAKPALKVFLGEFAKESTWGPSGYLKARGLVAAPDDVRARNAAAVADLTPMDPSAVE